MCPDAPARRPLDAIAAAFEPDSAISIALRALAHEANRLADLAEAQETRIAELERGQGFLAGRAGRIEARVNAALATRELLHGTSDSAHV